MKANEIASWVRIGCVVAAVGFGACKDEGFGTVAEDEAPETAANALCDQAQECDCFAGTQLTVDGCRTEYGILWDQLLAAGNDEGLTYDGACFGRFLDAYTSVGCAVEFDEDTFDEFVDDCSSCKLFHGSKRAGEPCSPPDRDDLFLADECAQGLACNGAECVDPCETVGEGESCLVTQCAQGLVCNYTFDSETQEELAVCTRPAGLGESCTELPCDDDLFCDPTTSTCQDPPPPGGEGDPCTTGCDENTYCDTTSPDPSGWVCTAVKEVGDACADFTECRSGECEDGVCLAPRPIACELL